MIYNSRNWRNDTTEIQKEKNDLFKCSFSVQWVKNLRTKEGVVIKKLGYVKA